VHEAIFLSHSPLGEDWGEGLAAADYLPLSRFRDSLSPLCQRPFPREEQPFPVSVQTFPRISDLILTRPFVQQICVEVAWLRNTGKSLSATYVNSLTSPAVPYLEMSGSFRRLIFIRTSQRLRLRRGTLR